MKEAPVCEVTEQLPLACPRGLSVPEQQSGGLSAGALQHSCLSRSETSLSVVLQLVPGSLLGWPTLTSSFPQQESLLAAASETSRQTDWFVSVSTDRSETSRCYDVIIILMSGLLIIGKLTRPVKRRQIDEGISFA